jgi:hypothetical protein
MNQPFIQSCLILSRASSQIYSLCASNAAQMFGKAVLSAGAPSWRESIDRTLALTSECMKEGTAALDAVWQVQRASLDLDTVALALRTMQGIEADSASAQADLRARFAADCTKQVTEWFDALSTARDANDLMLSAAECAQAWQDALKRFGVGYAGLASRTMSSTLQGLRSSVQDPAAQAKATQAASAT